MAVVTKVRVIEAERTLAPWKHESSAPDREPPLEGFLLGSPVWSGSH